MEGTADYLLLKDFPTGRKSIQKCLQILTIPESGPKLRGTSPDTARLIDASGVGCPPRARQSRLPQNLSESSKTLSSTAYLIKRTGVHFHGNLRPGGDAEALPYRRDHLPQELGRAERRGAAAEVKGVDPRGLVSSRSLFVALPVTRGYWW